MKNATISLVTCFLLVACQPKTPSEVSEKLVIDSLNAFYANLDVDSYASKEWSELVTADFKVFEEGKSMDLNAYLNFTNPSADLAETNWDLSSFDVLLDNNTAHVSYINDGFFRHSNLEVTAKWMESALFVLEDGVPKLRFLNANLVDRQVKKFDSN